MDFSEIAGVIFDKDGTLADFDSLWIPAAVKVVEAGGSISHGSIFCCKDSQIIWCQ